jgi:hypothetical protein
MDELNSAPIACPLAGYGNCVWRYGSYWSAALRTHPPDDYIAERMFPAV